MLRMTFGKHKGVSLDQIPADYWLWLADSEKATPTWKAIARKQLGVDVIVTADDALENQPADQRPAAILFPRVCFLWAEIMAGEFRTDRAAMRVVERGTAVLKELCEGLTGRRFPTPEEMASARDALDAESAKGARQ